MPEQPEKNLAAVALSKLGGLTAVEREPISFPREGDARSQGRQLGLDGLNGVREVRSVQNSYLIQDVSTYERDQQRGSYDR